MNDQQTFDFQTWLEDARAKLAALPDRQRAERETAKAQGRKPFPLIPLTEVQPATLAIFLASLANVPDELAETVGTLRRVCAEHPKYNFAMRSDQLLAVAALQKPTEAKGPDANVQR